MNLCIFEDDRVAHLYPLVRTRAVYDLRIGIRTLAESLRDAFGSPPTLLHARSVVAPVTAQEHDRLTNRIPEGLDVLFVNGRYLAEEGPLLERLRQATRTDEPGCVFVQDTEVVAAWVPKADSRLVGGTAITRETFAGLPEEHVEGARFIGRLWHLVDEIRGALHRDYTFLTRGYNIYERPSADVQGGALLVEGERIFIAPGAVIRPGAILNATDGPIFIDREAVVMERAVIRGPAYVGPRSRVNVGADINGVAIGPQCKVGGEVHDSVVHSCSNKAHAGFLGNSYIGRWCNLGADTNSSNLKNDYGEVTLYSEATGHAVPTGRQFLGLFLGDHSKCGINTMFNTGTVVGVCCNLFGAGFHSKHISSFSWGGPQNPYVPYRLDKALGVAKAVMARRNHPFTEADQRLLKEVFDGVQGPAIDAFYNGQP